MTSHNIVFAITWLVCIVTVSAQFRGHFWGSITTSCGNSSSLGNVFRYGHYCSGIFTGWYRNEVEAPVYRYPGDAVPFQNKSQQWDEVCRWGWNMGRCFDSILPECNSGIGVELLNNPKFILPFGRRFEGDFNFGRSDKLLGFYRKTCTGQTLKTDIRNTLEDATLDVNTTCFNTTTQEDFNKCSGSLAEESIDGTTYTNSDAKREAVNKAAEAAVNCMYSVINRSPCNTATKRMLYHVAKLQLPSFIDESELSLDESTTMDFTSHLRCTVGVYGDPHLRMCFVPGLTTCSAQGPQILIANGWFIVAGEHRSIGRGGSPPATSLRSIQLHFYSLDLTQQVATYTATGGSLPKVFDGAANSTVAGLGNDEVTITTDGYRVEFVQKSTGMILKLRQWSGNYFFTLRVAQGVIKKSYGLLASGCPTNQIIKRSTWRRFGQPARRKRATQESCQTACNSTLTDETLRDICAFDCFATDDVEFGVNMTSSAEVDIVEIETRDEEIRASAVTVTEKPMVTKKPENPSTASSTSPAPALIISSIVCVITSFIRTSTQ